MPIRRNQDMHRGRISFVAGIYFVTCCLKARDKSRLGHGALNQITDMVRDMDAYGDTRTLAFVAMPDHLHWLFAVGERLTLTQVVAKLKFLSRQVLAADGAQWQRDCYEHRLRSSETLEDYGLYIFLNPYRAGLVSPEMAWPHWWTGQPCELSFMEKLSPSGGPPTEWLGRPVPAGVGSGY